jgi:hypothetical protein
VDVVADLPADPQPTEPVQQRDGLLHHPAVHAQARAVPGAAPGDHRGNALVPDMTAVFVMVIGPVRVDPIGPLPRATAPAADRRDCLDQRHQLGDVVAVAAGQRDRQRDAVRFGDQVVLRARPGAVNRARAGFGPPFIALTCELSTAALDQSSAPGGIELGQQRLVQLLPDPGLVPVAQPPPARHAGPEPQLLWQELPRDPGVQHEQDAAHRLAVIQPPAARVISPPGHDRQQRLDPGPQLVCDDPWWLLSLSHGQPQLPRHHRYSHRPFC